MFKGACSLTYLAHRAIIHETPHTVNEFPPFFSTKLHIFSFIDYRAPSRIRRPMPILRDACFHRPAINLSAGNLLRDPS